MRMSRQNNYDCHYNMITPRKLYRFIIRCKIKYLTKPSRLYHRELEVDNWQDLLDKRFEECNAGIYKVRCYNARYYARTCLCDLGRFSKQAQYTIDMDLKKWLTFFDDLLVRYTLDHIGERDALGRREIMAFDAYVSQLEALRGIERRRRIKIIDHVTLFCTTDKYRRWRTRLERA